jgi:hypothetical protein
MARPTLREALLTLERIIAHLEAMAAVQRVPRQIRELIAAAIAEAQATLRRNGRR